MRCAALRYVRDKRVERRRRGEDKVKKMERTRSTVADANTAARVLVAIGPMSLATRIEAATGFAVHRPTARRRSTVPGAQEKQRFGSRVAAATHGAVLNRNDLAEV